MRLLRIAIFLFVTAGVYGHPLGNFSVNQYTGLEVGKHEIRVLQVLDLAEIPTFQAGAEIDLDKDGQISQAEIDAYMAKVTPEYIAGLSLSVDGAALPLVVTGATASVRPGEGDLPIGNFRWELVATLPERAASGSVRFANANNADRVGWNEVVIRAAPGVSVFDSTAFGSGLSDELRAFPADRIASPLAERSAEFSFSGGGVPAGARPLRDRDGKAAAPAQRDRLTELIREPRITPLVAAFALLVAFGLGAMHAMSPGHGKAVVGAYLVGSKGTARHAAFLGLTVTVTHTIGVFALGFLTLFASRYILPERLMPVLSFASGLLVLYLGLSMFKTRLFAALGAGGGHAHGHADLAAGEIAHSHGGSTHTHSVSGDLSRRSLIALGVSGGLLPCPSALVLMLSAINLGRVGYGLVLTVAFSFGLAATLTAVGLLFLYGGKIFDGERFRQSRIVQALPVFSAFVIACLGAVICYTSL